MRLYRLGIGLNLYKSRPFSRGLIWIDPVKENWQAGDKIFTTNIPVETVKDIDRNYSTQKNYEYLVRVEGNGNQYKNCEIYGKIIAQTTHLTIPNVPYIEQLEFDPYAFMCKHLDASSDEIENWKEKVNKLPFADFDNILDLMTASYNAALVGEVSIVEIESTKICMQTGNKCGMPCNGEENCKSIPVTYEKDGKTYLKKL